MSLPQLSAAEIIELCEYLQDGVEISQIPHHLICNFTEKQLEQIQLGAVDNELPSHLLAYYVNPEFNSDQMFIIRTILRAKLPAFYPNELAEEIKLIKS